jgi:hypothetical protein
MGSTRVALTSAHVRRGSWQASEKMGAIEDEWAHALVAAYTVGVLYEVPPIAKIVSDARG